MQDLRILLVVIARDSNSFPPALAQSVLAAGFDPLIIDTCSERHRPAADQPPWPMLHLNGTAGAGTVVHAAATYAAGHGYDAMVTMAGDGACDPTDLDRLVAEAREKGPALILGIPRNCQGTADFWVRLECGVEITDPGSSFRLYPVKELLALKIGWQNQDFAIESVVRFAWAGIPVVPVAVAAASPDRNQEAGKSKIKEKLRLIRLHSRLVGRRLLPVPHQRMIPEEPLGKKVYESLAQNPFRVLGQACGEHASPLWLAMAVWLGIFMGALPLLSIHTIAILYVAHRLHVNKVVAVAASQLCMPPFVPWICIQIGYYLRKGNLLLDFSWQKWLLEVHERFWEWLIGSLLLGPLLGLLGAGLMYWMVLRWQKRTTGAQTA